MTVSVVTFDAGNTLFTERLGRDEMYASALAARGQPVDVATLAEARRRLHDQMPESWHGHARYTDGWFLEFIARLLSDLRCSAGPEDLRAELAQAFTRPDAFVVYADTISALETLTELGLRLAVVSNWSDRLGELLEGLGLRAFFEAVVISAELGHSKPSRAIFDGALEQLDVDRRCVVHVGNHPINDLAGARRAGWRALLVDREGVADPADYVVHSLEDVAGRLASVG